MFGGSVVSFVMEFHPEVVAAMLFNATDSFVRWMIGNVWYFSSWGRWCAGNVCDFWEEMLELL